MPTQEFFDELATVSQDLADKLHVADADQFERLLYNAMERAYRHSGESSSPPRPRDVRVHFERLRKALTSVRFKTTLHHFTASPFAPVQIISPVEDEAALLAAAYLELAMEKLYPDMEPGWADRCLDVVNLAERMKKSRKRKGRRPSVVGMPLTTFLLDLFVIERECVFEWSAYRDRKSGEITGSLIDTIEALKPLLPNRLIPASRRTLLNHIDQVRIAGQ